VLQVKAEKLTLCIFVNFAPGEGGGGGVGAACQTLPVQAMGAPAHPPPLETTGFALPYCYRSPMYYEHPVVGPGLMVTLPNISD
jgi:hypothetical protein